MKKFFFLLLFILNACSSGTPTQTIQIINTGTDKCSLTLEAYTAEGVLSDKYAVDETIEPQKAVFTQVYEGIYLISVWAADGKLIRKFDKISIKLSEGKSIYTPIVIDTALDKNFALVNLNYLYSGGSFAENMSKSLGTHSDDLKILHYYSGSSPFFVPEKYRSDLTFVDVFTEKLPEETVYGNIVYGLIPVPAKITKKNDVTAYIENYLEKKI
ncbi:MAG TPA: hypothetical protein PK419_12470 [Spirochaetota bacterium]|nr:hypothetical protein [Spirochaetota bacterium]HPY04095.1 hypothetical protein [Spirochaetota bacterium]HQA53655.1 hypothetical protein [Spirochaetota bacterium]